MNTLLLVGLVVLSCIAGISWLIYESVSQSFPRERKPTRYQREMEAFIENIQWFDATTSGEDLLHKYPTYKCLKAANKRLQKIKEKYG